MRNEVDGGGVEGWIKCKDKRKREKRICMEKRKRNDENISLNETDKSFM